MQNAVQELAPSPPLEGTFERILLAIDRSQPSSYAVGWAKHVASACRGRVWVFTVLPGEEDHEMREMPQTSLQAILLSSEYQDVLARNQTGQVATDFDRSGIDAQPAFARGSVTQGIVRASNAMDANLIIVGSRGAGCWERFMVGSVSESVKNHTHSSLLIAKAPFRRGPVLVAIDGSPESARIARVGAGLARAWRVPSTLLHVASGHGRSITPAEQERYDQLILEAGLVRVRGTTRIEFAVGHVAERILNAARISDAALIVMGSRGLSGLRALLSGSVSNRVVHASPVPVLLVRGDDGHHPAAPAARDHAEQGNDGA